MTDDPADFTGVPRVVVVGAVPVLGVLCFGATLLALEPVVAVLVVAAVAVVGVAFVVTADFGAGTLPLLLTGGVFVFVALAGGCFGGADVLVGAGDLEGELTDEVTDFGCPEATLAFDGAAEDFVVPEKG